LRFVVSHPFRKERQKDGAPSPTAVAAGPELRAAPGLPGRPVLMMRAAVPAQRSGLPVGPAEPELAQKPETRVAAVLPVPEQRLEQLGPQALREQPLWALRLAPAVLPQVQAHRAEPGSAALPEFRASAAWTVRRAFPSAGDSAPPADRSRPPARRRRSDRPWEESPDGLGRDRGGLWRHRPVARG